MQTIWPELPYAKWRDTRATLHLWTQIVGKIRLAHSPWLNHSWQVPLYVTPRGLTTSPIPFGTVAIEIEFDFRAHELRIDSDSGDSQRIALQPKTVATFYREVKSALAELDVRMSINERPCEIAGAVPFSQDLQHASYDAEYAHRFWRILLQADRLFKQFRTGFLGKASPVHFFWGSFDLAVTRFSGRGAPLFAGSTPGVNKRVMQEAYSHEVSSAGFWPGGAGADDAAFYSYTYPEAKGFSTSAVLPAEAKYNEALGQFLLPYDAVRRSADPDATLLAFLRSTYAAAARSGNWDASLECPEGTPGTCRSVTLPA